MSCDLPPGGRATAVAWAAMLLLFSAAFPCHGQDPIGVLPGNPKGDLATELLQSVTAARSMEATLKHIIKSYPTLKVRAVAAEAAWLSSPFARGARHIENDIKKDAGKDGADLLAKIDKMSRDAINEYVPVDTLAKAREFLQLAEQRSRGIMPQAAHAPRAVPCEHDAVDHLRSPPQARSHEARAAKKICGSIQRARPVETPTRP